MTDEKTITRLVRQAHDANRVSVFLDGVFAFGVHEDLVLEYGLARGRTLSAAEQAAVQAAQRLHEAKAMALNYLAYRPRTEHEVREKLRAKAFEAPTVDAVVERLYALHYLDDGAYARTYARGRLANRGYGPERIRLELHRRGVAPPLIEQALADAFAEDELLEQARAQARGRWPRLAREPDPRKRRKKLSDFLVRRGFPYDVVRQVVDEVGRQAGGEEAE